MISSQTRLQRPSQIFKPLEANAVGFRNITDEYSEVVNTPDEYRKLLYVKNTADFLIAHPRVSFVLDGVIMTWDEEKDCLFGWTASKEIELARDFAMIARSVHGIHMDIEDEHGVLWMSW